VIWKGFYQMFLPPTNSGNQEGKVVLLWWFAGN